MQNYREANHAHRDDHPEAASPSEDSRTSPRELLGVILAAVLVAIVLSMFALLAARLDPGAEDCVLTDNAGCIDVGSTGSAREVAAGADLRREV